jgi:predicted nucleic acid-binding protein
MSILMRDVPPTFRWLGYVIIMVVGIYRAAPLVAGVLNAPGEIDRMSVRVEALEDSQKETLRALDAVAADLARAICLLEVVTEKRHNPLECR